MTEVNPSFRYGTTRDRGIVQRSVDGGGDDGDGDCDGDEGDTDGGVP